jgi:hypothetical protein
LGVQREKGYALARNSGLLISFERILVVLLLSTFSTPKASSRAYAHLKHISRILNCQLGKEPVHVSAIEKRLLGAKEELSRPIFGKLHKS